MRQWWEFVRVSFRRGWGWFVNVGNHTAPIYLVAALAGVSYLSWTNRNLWVISLFVVSAAFVCFSVGAYQEWQETNRAIAEVLLPSFEASLRQLNGERGRANKWLETLRDDPSDTTVGQIELYFDVMWLQMLEQLIKHRSPSLWVKFSNPDHGAAELEPVAADERERVFRKVRDAVRRLDDVIAEYERSHKDIKDFLER